MVVALVERGEWHGKRVPFMVAVEAEQARLAIGSAGPVVKSVGAALRKVATIDIDALDDELIFYSEMPLGPLASALRQALGSEIDLGWGDST